MTCVRCGDEPRHLDGFLCLTCSRDDATRREWMDAQRETETVKDQRLYLMERWQWAGGWHRRERVA